MGLRIATNVAALNAHRNLSISDASLSRSLERLSSGYRVNRAADDAAGLSMSNKFVAQIRAMGAASRNTSQATSLLQIAEGGTEQIQNMLTRLKELATQAASANSNSNLTDINAEAGKLISEIDRIANATTFQSTALLTGYGLHSANNVITSANVYDFDVSNAAEGVYLVSASATTVKFTNTATNVSQSITWNANGTGQTMNFTSFGISFKTTAAFLQASGSALAADIPSVTITVTDTTFQVGETNGTNYQLGFQIDDSQTAALSVDGVDMTSAANAKEAMTLIDAAITKLNTNRANIGAIQNRLSYTYANLSIAVENASAANSVIKDVDMAGEMIDFTKSQILLQAGTAMLAQANMAPQQVLALFG